MDIFFSSHQHKTALCMTVNNNQSVTVLGVVFCVFLFILCLSIFMSDIFKEREKRKNKKEIYVNNISKLC